MPTLNDVLAGSLQQSVQVQQIIDALKGTPNKGVPIALVSLNDPSNYALTVQNDDPTNSRALSILKADGTPFLTCDINGVSLGSPTTPVILPTGSVTSGMIADGTVATVDLANNAVTNAKLGTDTARLNLLTNGGFEIWQRGNGPVTAYGAYAADRWANYWTGTDTLSISRDTSNIDAGSIAAAACTFVQGSGTTSAMAQILKSTDGYVLANKTLSISMRVRTSTANAVRVALVDATNSIYSYSAFHSGSGSYETLTATASFASTCTQVQAAVRFSASCTVYVDNASVVAGAVPADFATLHPADDLARCLRYYEFLGVAAASDVIISGNSAGAGQGYNFSFPWRALKVVTPTVTVNPTWNTSNCSAPTASSSSLNMCRLGTTATASGFFNAYNGTAGSNVSAESNP